MSKDQNLIGNERITEAIQVMYQNMAAGDSAERKELAYEALAAAVSAIRKRGLEKGHFVVAVNTGENGMMALRPVKTSDGLSWFAAYTDFDEQSKGKDRIMSGFTAEIFQILRMALSSEGIAGVIVNPWENPLKLDQTLLQVILSEEGN